jgi:hypothetical protein
MVAVSVVDTRFTRKLRGVLAHEELERRAHVVVPTTQTIGNVGAIFTTPCFIGFTGCPRFIVHTRAIGPLESKLGIARVMQTNPDISTAGVQSLNFFLMIIVVNTGEVATIADTKGFCSGKIRSKRAQLVSVLGLFCAARVSRGRFTVCGVSNGTSPGNSAKSTAMGKSTGQKDDE